MMISFKNQTIYLRNFFFPFNMFIFFINEFIVHSVYYFLNMKENVASDICIENLVKGIVYLN